MFENSVPCKREVCLHMVQSSRVLEAAGWAVYSCQTMRDALPGLLSLVGRCQYEIKQSTFMESDIHKP